MNLCLYDSFEYQCHKFQSSVCQCYNDASGAREKEMDIVTVTAVLRITQRNTLFNNAFKDNAMELMGQRNVV